MITATPRVRALLAGGTALVALGLTAPVMAAPDGANGGCGAYCPSGDGAPSGNGNATNQPAAGTVGRADEKNPHGQEPDESDVNNGYECDGNHGIAQGNPAHSGCAVAPDPETDPDENSDTGEDDDSDTGGDEWDT